MHVILLEPDLRQQSLWIQRLEGLGAEVCLIAHDEDWQTALDRTQAAIAFCRIGVDDTNPELTADLLRPHANYLIAIAPDASSRSQYLVYHAGFDDCISADSDDEVLIAKLSHAEHVRKLDQRLAQAQKLESIGELAAGIAHEINTPIQYVGDNTRFVKDAYADLEQILRDCQSIIQDVEAGNNPANSVVRLRDSIQAADLEYLSGEIPTAIVQTLEGVDRVSNIVRAMKEFAHPGATELTPTDLAKAVENTVIVARNEWKYVAEMVTDFDDQMASVPALPGELNQVLLNLIVNASHAIADSLGATPSSKGVISISTRQVDGQAEIRISDTGSGISQENLQRIFKPFFTTKPAGKGTGQGLAIAREVIVEKHGGRLEVESEVGTGTTFVIRLPFTRAAHSNGEEILV